MKAYVGVTDGEWYRQLAEQPPGGPETALHPQEDPVIGCLLVRDTRFFTGQEAADPPPEFAPSVVQGKVYDLAERR